MNWFRLLASYLSTALMDQIEVPIIDAVKQVKAVQSFEDYWLVQDGVHTHSITVLKVLIRV